MIVRFGKGLCLGLRAYAIRLEALRSLGFRNLEGWKASGGPPEGGSTSPSPLPICYLLGGGGGGGGRRDMR